MENTNLGLTRKKEKSIMLVRKGKITKRADLEYPINPTEIQKEVSPTGNSL